MKYRTFLLLLYLTLLAPSWVSAQVNWRDLPPDERHQLRQQMRQEMREHWEKEHDSERVWRRDPRHEERREANEPARWRDLPPEDRRRMRDEMRELREQRAGGEAIRPHRDQFERPPGRGWRRD